MTLTFLIIASAVAALLFLCSGLLLGAARGRGAAGKLRLELDALEGTVAAQESELAERRREARAHGALDERERDLSAREESLETSQQAVATETKTLEERAELLSREEHTLAERSSGLHQTEQRLEARETALKARALQLDEREGRGKLELLQAKDKLRRLESVEPQARANQLRLERAEQRVRELEATLSTQRGDDERHRRELATLREELSSAHLELDRLRVAATHAGAPERRDELRRSEGTLERQLSSLRSAHEALQVELEERAQALDEAEARRDELQTLLRARQGSADRSQREALSAANALRDARGELREKERLLQKALSDGRRLQRQQDESREEQANARSQLESRLAQLEPLPRRLAAEKGESETLRQQLAATNQQLLTTQRTLADQQPSLEELEGLRQRLDERNREHAALVADLEKLQANLDATRRDARDGREETSALRRELDQEREARSAEVQRRSHLDGRLAALEERLVSALPQTPGGIPEVLELRRALAEAERRGRKQAPAPETPQAGMEGTPSAEEVARGEALCRLLGRLEGLEASVVADRQGLLLAAEAATKDSSDGDARQLQRSELELFAASAAPLVALGEQLQRLSPLESPRRVIVADEHHRALCADLRSGRGAPVVLTLLDGFVGQSAGTTLTHLDALLSSSPDTSAGDEA